MSQYPKIQTIFKRDLTKPNKPLIEGAWTTPEFEYLADKDWIFTEKVDGMNIRVIWNVNIGIKVNILSTKTEILKTESNRLDTANTLTFAGRTDVAELPTQLLNRLRELFTKNKLYTLFPNTTVIFYGEGYGTGIQKSGHLYGPTQDFILFDVKIDKYWLRKEDVTDIASKLEIHTTPVVGLCPLKAMIPIVKEGFPSLIGNLPAEGVVGYPSVGLLARNGERIICKLKHRDFISYADK